MAEFMNQQKPKHENLGPDAGFNMMGKTVPFYRREAGFKHCKQMGLNTEDAYSVVGMMSEQLERDEPYTAMENGMVYLDLTGTYRLMAVLLTAVKPLQ